MAFHSGLIARLAREKEKVSNRYAVEHADHLHRRATAARPCIRGRIGRSWRRVQKSGIMSVVGHAASLGGALEQFARDYWAAASIPTPELTMSGLRVLTPVA
jgi:hypothetical protein